MTDPTEPTRPAPRRLAVFVAFSGRGGVERDMLALLDEFRDYPVAVDLLAVVRGSDILPASDGNLRVIDLGVRHTMTALGPLMSYLRRYRPDVLMAAKDRAIAVAGLARRLSGVRTRLVGRVGTHLSESLRGRSWTTVRWRKGLAYCAYRMTDRIIAVSEGVAEDTRRLARLAPGHVVAVANPVIPGDLNRRAAMSMVWPWSHAPNGPVIMAAGRLTEQKDFKTLIRAFALVRPSAADKLLILGEGQQRAELQQLIDALNLTEAVAMPGHVDNIHAFLSRAALFVLSSKFEGFGNVLVEALSLGIPAVATDCRSGPREILQDGRLGPLVPVGDVQGLAAAIRNTLRSPLPAATLRDGVQQYTTAHSARRYAEVLGIA